MKKEKETEYVIGIKDIIKNVKAGKIKKVLVAKNCPTFLLEKLKSAGSVEIETFDGDQVQLATKLGKPFPIAMYGIIVVI